MWGKRDLFREFAMNGSKRAWTALLGGSALVVASLTMAASSARAADDGYAPLWEGIGASIGLVPANTDPAIDYRERARLVLPKTKDLPPPGSAHAANPAWPKDPDVRAAKQAKLDAEKPPFRGLGGKYGVWKGLEPTNVTGPITVDATAGQGPAQPLCDIGSKTCSGGTNGIMQAFGVETTPLGPEPSREWLTDPPQGLRAPVGPLPTPTPAH
jgi:hypothetical protein